MPKIPKKIEAKKVLAKTTDEEIKDTDIDTEEDNLDEPTPKLKSKQDLENELQGESEVEEDYLQQYQYKKVNNIPTIGGVLTDPDKGGKAEKMKEHLLGQKKISILIPLPEGSDPKVLHSVTLNGYRLDFPTNTYVEVPEQIAEVIRNSNNQTIMALNQFKIGGGSKTEDALS